MTQQPNLLSGEDRIVDVDIAQRMEQSFLDYSMSVIVGRALPDVRDGLKPVQRRILFAMWEAGLRPERPYRKCASAVGDVMKKYHPHGDSSIYDALVRMAQDFTSRAPLVDGHVNFGSVDGDPAAAMRYTEARLSAIAMQLLAGIDSDTVDFVPNYDGYEHEPVVLPARLPNLLVNGASGIAVGMATNIPPHNLGETIDACRHLIRRPDATVDDLMRFVPAPDFPTGARIVDTAGIRDAYLTGRGAVTLEAVATTETRAGRVPRVIVTEIPYQVNKATLLERIADLVKDKKVDAIRDLRDESSRDGMRIVVELKRDQDPARVLDRLYALTDLRTNFNVNLVALVDGQPRTVGLREALVAYLGHQRTVLTRRTKHRRDKAAARAHLLEGLLVALDHLDEVIALIRAAPTADDARGQLMERFDLDEVQATAILDMMLRRLAALERQKIAEEHRELLALIAQLDEILADPAKLDALLADELGEVKAGHADARRSRLATAPASVDEGQPADALPRLEAQPVTVYVTAGGYLRSVARRRQPKPHPDPRDPLVALLDATTGDTVLVVDADGGGYRIAVTDLPVVTLRQRGTTVAQLLGEVGSGIRLAGAVLLRDDAESVLTVSARGLVKRTPAPEYVGRTQAMIAAGV
ncbi:MAG: DNA gyrase/topoisomerase IV subunit A, partial [Egibacteraceae bacterium]